VKVYTMEQGTPEWVAARLGIPTASAFDRILTPATRKPSAQADAYLHELLAEWLLGQPAKDGGDSAFMARGRDMEDRARGWYEFTQGQAVERVGFCTTDDGLVGCSPDSLVGDEGGLEIKCPSIWWHVAYMLEPSRLAADYHGQVQGGLWVTGRAWWDLESYNPSPSVHPVVVRVRPDAAYHAALSAALGDFRARLLAGRSALLAQGCAPRPPAKPSTLNEEGMPW